MTSNLIKAEINLEKDQIIVPTIRFKQPTPADAKNAYQLEVLFKSCTNMQGQPLFEVSAPALRMGMNGITTVGLSLAVTSAVPFGNKAKDLPTFRAYIQQLLGVAPQFRGWTLRTTEYIEICLPSQIIRKFQATFRYSNSSAPSDLPDECS